MGKLSVKLDFLYFLFPQNSILWCKINRFSCTRKIKEIIVIGQIETEISELLQWNILFFRRLVEKLENMKKNAMGNGQTQCILCGDEFGLLGASPTHCDDCKNVNKFSIWKKIPITVEPFLDAEVNVHRKPNFFWFVGT